MIELKFSGKGYADILAECKDWLAQQEALGNELTKLARDPQPEPMPNYIPAGQEGNVLPFTAPVATSAPALMPTYSPTAAAPAPAPMPTYPPMAPAPAQMPAASPSYPSMPVPTAAPEYTQENLMNAGARLMNTVGLPAMQQLLARFGVPAIHQLPKERYGEFAQALRDMGGTI
jgi:hypothetical protein